MKQSLAFTLLWMAVLSAPIASAAPAKPQLADRRATAAALFQEGINDMQAGKTAEGCRKLAESVATMPDSGSMGALAECYTALGSLSEAWELWRDLSTSAPTAELRDDAAKNAAALDKRLAHIALHVRGSAPSDLVVTLNGKPVSAKDTDKHRVVPGQLIVVASSPDIETWTHTYDVREGKTVDIEIRVAESSTAISRRKRGRLLGFTLLGASAVALGVAAVYGGAAYSDWNSAQAACGGNTDHCKSAGYATAQGELASARHAATISSWSAVIGVGTAAAGALVLVLSARAPSSSESGVAWRASPMLGSRTLGIALTGSLP